MWWLRPLLCYGEYTYDCKLKTLREMSLTTLTHNQHDNILLYESEIWGAHTLPNSNKEFKLETSMKRFPSEKLNIKFSKFILGVHKKSSNFAVLGELGRYSLFITIINTILKYLNRIKELDHDSLLYQSFLESKSIWQSGKESWFSNVNKILKELNTNIEDYDINSVKKNSNC